MKIKKLLILLVLLLNLFSCNSEVTVTVKYMDYYTTYSEEKGVYLHHFKDDEAIRIKFFKFEKNHVLTLEELRELKEKVYYNKADISNDVGISVPSCYYGFTYLYFKLENNTDEEDMLKVGYKFTTDITLYYGLWP